MGSQVGIIRTVSLETPATGMMGGSLGRSPATCTGPWARLLLAVLPTHHPMTVAPHSLEEYLALPGRALLKGWRGPVLAAEAAFLAAARASAMVGLRLVL